MRLRASALIGRDRELRTVSDIVDGVVAGSGAAAAIVGEPGIGKTRVVGELLRSAAERDCVVAVGRATAGLPAPFRPVTEALLALERQYSIRSRTGAQVWARFLRPVVPAWGSADGAGETTVPVIGAALLRCLDAAGDGRPVLLVLEDLHWADAETLALVEFVADNAAASTVALVATMRPDPGEAVGIFRRLERRRSATVLELLPLAAHDVSTLVRDCLGGSVLPEVERFVVERCDGNPLFAEELLAGLQSSGSLHYDTGGWRADASISAGVPNTLADAVRDRMAALGDEDRTVVDAAAVLGRRFDWRTVQAMTDLSGDRVLASLRRAADIQLVEFRDGEHQFRHALTCDVVRDAVPDATRRELAARALERVADRSDVALLAGLAEQAGEHDAALGHLRALAAEHIAQGALSSATSVLRHAELLAAHVEDRVDVAIELAAALLLAGDGAAARRVCESVRPLVGPDLDPDRSRRAELHVLLARASILLGEWSRADEEVKRAEAFETSSVAVRPEVDAVAAHLRVSIGRLDDALPYAEAAITGALEASRPEIACEALEAVGRSARFQDPAASREAFRRSFEIADDAGLHAWRLRALHEISINEAFIDWRFDRLAELRREADAMDAVLTLAVVDLHDAGSRLIGGDVGGAEAATLRCVDACRRYRLNMLPIALVHEGVLAAFAGDRAAADAAVAEALELAPEDLDVRSQSVGWVDATFALAAGEFDEWWHDLDAAMSIVGDSASTIPSPWRGQWALSAAVRGDDGPARRLRASHAGVVLPNRVHLAMIEAIGSARAGHPDDADRTFAAADELLIGERSDLLRHVARIVVAPNAVEFGWGEPAAWLRAAESWASVAGLDGLTSAIRSMMRRLDVPVPRRGRGSNVVPPEFRRLGVTSREMDVLVLLVDRCSNREIANRLHLSVRTVEKHVASLLAKTSTADRHELALLVAAPA